MSRPTEWERTTADPAQTEAPPEPRTGLETGPQPPPPPERCPACGESAFHSLVSAVDHLYAITPAEFQLVECHACRLIRLHPQPSPEHLRGFYPRDYWLEPDRPLHPPQFRGMAITLENIYRHVTSLDLVRFLRRSLDESAELSTPLAENNSNTTANPGLVLDVGPRGGLRLSLLAGHFANTLAGLDFAVDTAQQTLLKRRIPVVCGTLSRAPFAPSSCALICMAHVLEHLYDPVPYLNAAHQLLAPDGRLIIQIYNASSWQFLLFGERWSGLNVPRHLVQFRRDDARHLLDDCGFEILREKHFCWRDSPATCATSLAPWLDPSVRRLRGTAETSAQSAWKTAAYTLLCAVCAPFTMLEAICRSGSSIIFEARKKS